ncbi:hypothetical protein ACTXJO_04505 [Psychrobacter celer]|uniref:hypothetical protein n=1 Tax=Psychrobacter celer TaxID=306572 RepID=UPI003FD66CCF
MTDIRVDCLLGYELRVMRAGSNQTLLTMSEALGWPMSKLSNYEHKTGSLTDDHDAKAIEDYCEYMGYKLPASAKTLSKQEKLTDLTGIKARFAKWREDAISRSIEA